MKKLYVFALTGALLVLGNLQAQTSPPCTYIHSLAGADRNVKSPSSHNDEKSLSTVNNEALEDEYDVHFYWLDLDIENPSSYISGNVMIQASSLINGLDTFALDLDSSYYTVDSVNTALNFGSFQRATQFSQSGNNLLIILPFSADTGQTIQTRVYYHGTAGTSSGGFPDGNAFFQGNSQVFSASPPYNSSTWWPCKQNLNDKADSSWFFITTDSSNMAMSNGLLTNTVPADSGKICYQWKSHHIIDFYLISFIVGQYTETTEYFHPIGRTDSMPVQFYNLSPSYTLDCLQKYSTLFGLYPFYDEKYAIASVDLEGGMENQTMVELGFIGTVIAHETMHQWFGDNVTCGSFKDLFLNEGFARWAESLYPELSAPNPDSAQAARIAVCNQYENGSALYGLGGLGYPTGSIYNYNTDTIDILRLYANEGRGMNYEKAAMMINSLRFEVNNDSIFFLGLKNYQTIYAGKTAVTNDLIDVMENTTGMDLTDFFNQWFFGYGFPTFNIKWNQKDGQLALAITEAVSDSAETPLFKTSVQITIQRMNDTTEEDTTIRLFISQNVTNLQLPCGDSVTGFIVDPHQWILNGPGTVAHDSSLAVDTTATTSSLQTLKSETPLYKVYPNPASDFVNIQFLGTNNQPIDAELYNTMGQVVLHQKVYSNEPLYLSGFADGLYVLQLNQAYDYRVLIQR